MHSQFLVAGCEDPVRIEQVLNNFLMNVIKYGKGKPAKITVQYFEHHLSREIIMAHGGKIWVESNQGEGSTFSIDLLLKGPLGNLGLG